MEEPGSHSPWDGKELDITDKRMEDVSERRS